MKTLEYNIFNVVLTYCWSNNLPGDITQFIVTEIQTSEVKITLTNSNDAIKS